MGLKKNWDTMDISNQISALSRECSSPYNDGFTAFEFKKDLYQIKYMIDRALKTAPDFGDMEQQWLTEQEKKRIIKHLKS
jgi:hypothetical protein